MEPGKMASQLGHAFTESLLLAQCIDPSRFQEYRADGLGTKVCLTAPDLETLQRIYNQCNERGIPAALITDSGCANFFGGRPTITALGVGPAKKHETKKILGRLKLL